ncbi:hypothetical protein GOV11_00905 [Candidatus Woesearchaeota archaeon]|nr:hypothetical protein [Candidatus Woesearchaeota archaeon]
MGSAKIAWEQYLTTPKTVKKATKGKAKVKADTPEWLVEVGSRKAKRKQFSAHLRAGKFSSKKIALKALDILENECDGKLSRMSWETMVESKFA